MTTESDNTFFGSKMLHPEIDFDKCRVSKEELMADELKINTYELKIKIKIDNIKINTIGELKPYIKTLRNIEKLEPYLDDDDYIYMHKWFYFKQKGLIY